MPGMIVWSAGDVKEDAGLGFLFGQDDMQLDAPGWGNPTFAFYRLMLNTTAVDVIADTDPGSPILNATKCAFNFCIQEQQVALQGTSLTVATNDLAFGEYTNASAFARVPWLRNTAADANSATPIDSQIFVEDLHARDLSNALAPIFFGSVAYNHLFRLPNHWDSDAIYAMWNSRPQDEVVANISKALTQHILDRSKNGYTDESLTVIPTTGFYEVSITILRVRWEWLSLAAAVLVLSLAFLIATLVITRQQKVGIWKGSSLPLLYHGYDQLVERDALIEKASEMEDDARDVKVQLAEITLLNQRTGRRIVREGKDEKQSATDTVPAQRTGSTRRQDEGGSAGQGSPLPLISRDARSKFYTL